MEPLRKPAIRGFYEWLCTVFLSLVGLWLLVAIVIPIIAFLRYGKVLEW